MVLADLGVAGAKRPSTVVHPCRNARVGTSVGTTDRAMPKKLNLLTSMAEGVSDLARRLAENAEAVCRHYLSNGRRQGGYWLAGDVHNTKGRSLYVRLRGPSAGKGAAGKWTDAAAGEHGDLLDLIGAVQGLHGGDLLDEARRFLGLVQRPRPAATSPTPAGSPEAARRLFASSKPIEGTLAETYLRERGIADVGDDERAPLSSALLVSARSRQPRQCTRGLAGADRRGHRPRRHDHRRAAHLARPVRPQEGAGRDAAAGDGSPARARGPVRRGACARNVGGDGGGRGHRDGAVAAKRRCPPCRLAAALSAGHLAALLFPPGLRRLYVVRDNDPAGQWATEQLVNRAQAAGIEALVLTPTLGDWNDDLRQLGPGALATALRVQLAPEDVTRFWRPPGRDGRRR